MTKKASDFIVAVDDGHEHDPPNEGKRTPYIPGVGIIYENEFNRAAADFLLEALKRCGFRTVHTSVGDKFTSLAQRAKIANDANADIFVSIHYNHSGQAHPGSPGAQGVETLYYPEARAQKLAATVHKYLLRGTPQVNRGIKPRPDLVVLNSTKMPAILVEAGFMDDELAGYREAKLMKSQAFQKEVAEEICQGVCEYFGVSYVDPQQVDDGSPEVKTRFYRLYLDGKHVMSFQQKQNLVNAVSDALNKDTESIRVEKIYV